MNIFTNLFKRKKVHVEDLFDEKVVSIEHCSKDAIHLFDSNSPCFSKIGVKPNLGKDFSWPYHNGIPLAFIAQLKFSEINKNGELQHYPKKGLLYVFYIQDQSTWGFDPKDKGSWVTHFLDIEDTSFSEIDFPDDLDEYSKYGEKGIVGNKIKTYPNWEDQRISDVKSKRYRI